MTPPGPLARATPGGVLLALLPAGLTVWLAFHGGGFLAGGPATVAIVVLLLLAARIMLVRDPGEGVSRTLVVAVAALALFAGWTLLSATWSHLADRALIEADRVLLYLAIVVVFGCVGLQPWRLRWMVRGLAAAAAIVCCAALATRLLPDVFPVTFPTIGGDRLSYPLGYWNALGLMAATGVILCFGITADGRESPWSRVIAAAALVPLASALLLTLSRGGIAVAAVGIVLFAVFGHPRTLLSALAAAVPPVVVALASTYRADLLVSTDHLTAAAQRQGHQVAVVLVLCSLSAGVARWLLLGADRAVRRVDVSAQQRRRVLRAGAALALAVGLAGVIAADLPRQYHRFVGEGVPVASDQPLDRRARLTDPENTVRIEHWRVALDEFKRERAHGGGAGTFEINWYRYRRTSQTVTDAHSLYIEVLGELGLVGIVLLLTAIVAILTGVARRVNGPDRALFATILAALAAWALAAGIDWHWEMPAVSLGFFALGGAALARRSERGEEGPALRLALRVALAGALCVVMVLGPLRLLISEDQLKKALLTPPTASCHDVDEAAAKATAAVASRPQPYEIRAACELKAGRPYRAIALLREAIRRDPALWRLHYALAVARARAGLDPRPAARAALALNPRELAAYTAVAAFKRQDSARGWRRASRQLQLLAPPL